MELVDWWEVRLWEGEEGESSNRAELTFAEPCRSRRDAVLPTLAWAPEGWGCEGANEAPSRSGSGGGGGGGGRWEV